MLRKWMMLLLLTGITNILPGADLIREGKAQGRIFIPEQPSRPVILAAQELQEHLKAMTNADMLLAWRVPNKGDSGIVLTVRPESEWKGKESAQAFHIEEVEKPHPTVTIAGNTGIAVLFGVYQYLNDQGIQWFQPGEIGTNIPKMAALKINARKVTGTPSFIYRCLDFSGWHDSVYDCSDPVEYREKIHYEYDLWLLRNRLIFDRTIHQGDYFDFNRMLSKAGHALQKRCKLSAADLTKEPERFALVTRNFKQERAFYNAQICFSNETNIKNAVDSAMEHFRKLEETVDRRSTDMDEVNDVIDMSLSDCDGICECTACRKIAGEEPNAKDRLIWYFMNRVAKELNRQMPGKKIMLFAPYFELTQPPDDVKIEPNIIAIACRSHAWLDTPENKESYPFIRKHLEDIKATARAGAQMQCYDYFYWQETPQTLDILDCAVVYAKNGFKRYHAEVMQRAEITWPFVWTLAQFTWDSSRDPQELLNKYCTQYYGAENGKLIHQLLLDIHTNSRKMYRIIYGGPADTSAMLTDELIAKYRPALKKAESQVKGAELERLRRFGKSFEVQMQFAELYRAYCHALNERTTFRINDFKNRVKNFNGFWNENQMIRFNRPFMLKMVQKFAAVDFRKLKAQGREIPEENRLKELFAGISVPENIKVFWLPENWKFQLDVDDNGLGKGWQKVEFNDEKWPLISTYDMYEPQGYVDVDGRFWYRLNFKVPEFEKGRIMLRIGSLDDGGEVYVNGKLVITQTDANMWDKSFAVDVSEVLKPGRENTIAVRGYDATGGGGIWRPCAIYVEKK